MPVYVDDAYIQAKVGNIDCAWCHLVADTFSELQFFAARIGLKSSWLQNSDHYDVTPFMRNEAVRNGARQVSKEYAARVVRNMHRKSQGKEPLPLPEK